MTFEIKMKVKAKVYKKIKKIPKQMSVLLLRAYYIRDKLHLRGKYQYDTIVRVKII